MLIFVCMNIVQNQATLSKFAQDFKGVFTINHLKNLLEYKNSVDLYRQIDKLVQNKVLNKFCRGLYVLNDFDLEIVSQRLCEKSYLSLATILSQNLVIGTTPNQTVYAVKIGKGRTYQSEWGQIIHVGISPDLFFGFKNSNGILKASVEKSLLDTLYFYQKGFQFYFNIYSDINLSNINTKKVLSDLKKYKNPKFIEFVKGYLNAN